MLTKIIGSRNINLVQNWGKTGAIYGTAGAFGFLMNKIIITILDSWIRCKHRWRCYIHKSACMSCSF
ncbi:hypothetical protein CEXT_573981 [Caerostris extrusa]|uniref:Uncharacterized protein n=1 Tax=Caerostris extrusa TaxID=172846 RepID=A0AAV4RIK9_CAEEX|nr:hypothetical protein CEXT_573981 [Caerostris extrusa]